MIMSDHSSGSEESKKKYVYGYTGGTIIPANYFLDEHPDLNHAVHEFTKNEGKQLKVGESRPFIVNHVDGAIVGGECIHSWMSPLGNLKGIFAVGHDGTPKNQLSATYVRNSLECEDGPIYPHFSMAHRTTPLIDRLYKKSLHVGLVENPRRKGANVEFWAPNPKLQTKNDSYKSKCKSPSINCLSESSSIVSKASDSPPTTTAMSSEPAAASGNGQSQQQQKPAFASNVPYEYAEELITLKEQLKKANEALQSTANERDSLKQEKDSIVQAKEQKKTQKAKQALDAFKETFKQQFGPEWSEKSCNWQAIQTHIEKDPNTRELVQQLVSVASAANESTVQKLQEQTNYIKQLQEQQKRQQTAELQRREEALKTPTTSRFPRIQSSTMNQMKRSLPSDVVSEASHQPKRTKINVSVPQFVSPSLAPQIPATENVPVPQQQQQQVETQTQPVEDQPQSVKDVFGRLVEKAPGSATGKTLAHLIAELASSGSSQGIVSAASGGGNTPISMKDLFPESFDYLTQMPQELRPMAAQN